MRRELLRRWACALAGVVAVGALTGPSALANHNEPLRGQWHLDEGGTISDEVSATPDSSGHDLTGIVRFMTQVPGRFGNAFDVAGDSSEVRLSDPTLLEPSAVTVLAWIKRSGDPGPYHNVVAKGADDVCSAASWALYTGRGAAPGLQFYVNAAGLSYSPVAPDSVWDGAWHMVAGTYDGAAVRLYVDGQQVGAGTPASGAINYGLAHRELDIGNFIGRAACNGLDPHFPGAIDEPRVYSRALTPTEIARLAAAAGPDPPDLVPDTPAGPSPPAPPVADFGSRGQSLKVKAATRFSALLSRPSPGARIADYRWVISGPDRAVDIDCGGGSPAMSHPFRRAGTYRVALTVTDTTGAQTTTQHDLVIAKADTLPRLRDPAVFACESPASGEQASTADCVKSFAFGIVDVNSRGRPDDCFEIQARINPAIFKEPRASQTEPRQSLLRVYHAKIRGPVAINGLTVPVPEAVRTEYDSWEATIGVVGASSLPIRVGPFLSKNIPLNLQVKPNKKGVFHVFDVDQAIPAVVGGLPSRGALSIDLIYHASKVKVGIGLPKGFSFAGGKPAQGDLYLISDNVRDYQPDGIGLLVPQVLLGPILVKDLSFKYLKSQNLWTGGAEISLPGSPVGIKAGPPPPDFGFGLKNGRFDHAGFGVTFNPPARPDLFPPFHSVLLKHIGAAIGVNPVRLTGTIGFSAAEVVDEDGALFAAFASPSRPYEFPDDAGSELAPLAGRNLDTFSLAVGGTASLHVPVLGVLPLLNSYGLYEYPDYFEFGGGFSFGISFLKIDGGVHGFVLASQRRFNAEGGMSACLRGIGISLKFTFVKISPCLNVGAVVSSRGLGFCGVVPVPFPIFGTVPVTVGAGYTWGARTPDLKIFTCDYGAYREISPRAAAGTRYALNLPPRLPASMIRVRGQGAAPDVTVTDPRGHDVAASDDALVIQGTDPDTTLVALRHPIAGRWTVTAKDGSVPIAGVASADGLPPLRIRARVTGGGRRRALVYRITGAGGRKVTFAERGARTARLLGVASAASGRIAFAPAPGRSGRRRIVAMIESGGAPSRVVTVASYSAPGTARPARPRGLRVSRRKRTIKVAWNRVRGAARYEVLVELRGGSSVYRVTRRTRITLPDPIPRNRGRVTLNVLGPDGSHGPAAVARVRAVRR